MYFCISIEHRFCSELPKITFFFSANFLNNKKALRRSQLLIFRVKGADECVSRSSEYNDAIIGRLCAFPIKNILSKHIQHWRQSYLLCHTHSTEYVFYKGTLHMWSLQTDLETNQVSIVLTVYLTLGKVRVPIVESIVQIWKSMKDCWHVEHLRNSVHVDTWKRENVELWTIPNTYA